MMLPKIKVITKVVAAHFGYTEELLLSKSRKSGLIKARHSAIYLSATLTWYGRLEIAEAFEKNVSTISYIMETIRDAMSIDPQFSNELNEMKLKCEQALNNLSA